MSIFDFWAESIRLSLIGVWPNLFGSEFSNIVICLPSYKCSWISVWQACHCQFETSFKLQYLYMLKYYWKMSSYLTNASAFHTKFPTHHAVRYQYYNILWMKIWRETEHVLPHLSKWILLFFRSVVQKLNEYTGNPCKHNVNLSVTIRTS